MSMDYTIVNMPLLDATTGSYKYYGTLSNENKIYKNAFVKELNIDVIGSRLDNITNNINNQIFNVKEINVYQRDSGTNKGIVTYHKKGLVQEKVSFISNHFCCCRSTITYLIDKNINKKYKDITEEWLQNARPTKLKKLTKGDYFEFKGQNYLVDNHHV